MQHSMCPPGRRLPIIREWLFVQIGILWTSHGWPRHFQHPPSSGHRHHQAPMKLSWAAPNNKSDYRSMFRLSRNCPYQAGSISSPTTWSQHRATAAAHNKWSPSSSHASACSELKKRRENEQRFTQESMVWSAPFASDLVVKTAQRDAKCLQSAQRILVVHVE